MADNVRGITIELAADAKKFNAGMNELRRDAKQSQAELNALQKSLEIEFDADTFAKAQSVAQRAIDETRENAEILGERLKYLESIKSQDTAEYKKLQTEMAQTETKAKQLEQQLEQINKIETTKAQQSVKGLTEQLEGAAVAAGAVAAAATASLAAIGAMGLAAINSAAETQKLADQYGMTATALQRMNYIGLQASVSADDMFKALVKVRTASADLAAGISTKTSNALRTLNIDLNKFQNADEQFYAIIDALSKMENQTDMTLAANEIFGESLANNLVPIILAGGDAIAAYADEFEQLAPMTDEQVAALSAFDNVLNRLKTQFENVRNQIGAAFLPVLERLASIVSSTIVPALQKFAEWLNSLSDSQLTFIVTVLGVAAALGTLVLVLPKLISGVTAIKTSITQLNGSLLKLAANPIVVIIAVITAIFIVLYKTNEQFRQSINQLLETLINALAPILDVLMNALSALFEALLPILTVVGNLLAVIISVIVDALQPLFGIIETLVGILTTILQGALGMVLNLLGNILGVLMPLVDILGNVLTVVLNTVFTALAPVFAMLELIFSIIQPLIELALIPLQIQLQALSVPLQFLGELLNWLAPIFVKFGDFVKGVFDTVLVVINTILGAIETAINWVIDKINGLIRGINDMGGFLGIHINELQKVSLQISMGSTASTGNNNFEASAPPTTQTPTTPIPSYEGGDFVYDGIDIGNNNGDTYNNDYSNKEVNITNNITVQNYAEEVNVDELVGKINAKLAEVM